MYSPTFAQIQPYVLAQHPEYTAEQKNALVWFIQEFNKVYVDLPYSKITAQCKRIVDLIISHTYHQHAHMSLLYAYTEKRQRIHWVLRRFLWKYYILRRRIRDSTITTDMFMTPRHAIPENEIITIVSGGVRWWFTVRDMLRIWLMALRIQSGMFPEPRMPANPYTNKEFTWVQCVAIYDKLRRRRIRLAPLIERFVHANFMLQEFREQNWDCLVELAVQEYVASHLQEQEMRADTVEMIDDYYNYFYSTGVPGTRAVGERLYMVEDWQVLVRPLLCMFYKVQNLTNETICTRLKRRLQMALRRLVQQHPMLLYTPAEYDVWLNGEHTETLH